MYHYLIFYTENKMKKISSIFILGLYFLGLICISSCEEEDEIKGTLTFWTPENILGGDISVTLSNQGTRIITGYYQNAVDVDCGSAYTATFSDIPYGKYLYTASNSTFSWSDSITVRSGCERIKLVSRDAKRK